MNCPKCGKKMIERNGKNGPFLGCSGYPHCKMTSNLPKNGSEKKELRRIEKLSAYQADIENWVKNGSGHAEVMATAGSGKTRTQEHIVAVLIEDMKVSTTDIIYLAFNSHVVREAIEKGLPAKSTHQVGLAAVSSYVGKKVKVDENKVANIVMDLLEEGF